MTVSDLRFDAAGLIPAAVQEAETGELLMVAWMNCEAVEATLSTGLTHFWSRSRQVLWRKGETSGHAQHVDGFYVDCDADTLLVQVHQDGVACHTGHRTCFYRALRAPGPAAPADPRDGGGEGSRPDGAAAAQSPVDTWTTGERGAPFATMLERLEGIVASRKASAPAGSYVGGLLAGGEPAICRKIGEEAVEVITAALGGEGDARLVEEVADLWFHTIVLLGRRGVALREVLKELGRRHERRSAPPPRPR